MNKEELKSKLDIVKDYIKFNTDAEKIADICNNNAHQQIGYYLGALKQIKADLEVIKEMLDEQ